MIDSIGSSKCIVSNKIINIFWVDILYSRKDVWGHLCNSPKKNEHRYFKNRCVQNNYFGGIPRAAILISDEICVKTKAIIKDKEEYYIMIKESV